MTKAKVAPKNETCPRCGGPMPALGAVSREDGSTYVCTTCGEDEAFGSELVASALGRQPQTVLASWRLRYGHGQRPIGPLKRS
jgi:ribosomal protein S27AE